jgi:hypothetical protein
MLASAIMTGAAGDMREAADEMKSSEGSGIRFRTDRYRGIYYQSLPYFMTPDEIKAVAPPSGPAQDWRFANASWDYAQTLALVRMGDTDKAEHLLAALQRDAATFERENPDQTENGKVMEIMVRVAAARLKELEGNPADGLATLKQAEALQKSIYYDEPPYWLVPVEQTEAALLIALGRYDEAIDMLHSSLGEHLHDDVLPATAFTRFLGNGWAYYGLTLAYAKKSTLTDEERADYEHAKGKLAGYCPSGTACSFSPERM